ncbi:MAG: mercuric transport protein [Campylobacterales bacterium]|nr:mercuric transport protein [Campylobacterales bacterium]
MRSEWLGLGALFSALLALSCCGSALLFLLFGVSFAWLGALEALAPYRIYFELLALTLLAWAWIRLYRRRACALGRKRTVFFLSLITLTLGVLLALPYLPWA